MHNSSGPPIIAVVVPLFRHSVLIADALRSVLDQNCRYPFHIIVVNDGCTFRESDVQVKCILSLHPDSISYLVQANKGLSAARNAGINYALEHFPTIQAIYFLDADNILLPGALDSSFSKLEKETEASWIYPNIDMFGLKQNFDYSGPYSVFRHSLFNICEAGSLVHRRVFDAGIRFDETMRLGYEDWDFWLTSAGRGFRGAQHPHFGFRYRNRGESMLTQAHRDNSEILGQLKRKHPFVLGRYGLMRSEAKDSFRYAIHFTDVNEVLMTSGSPEQAKVIPQAEFDEMFWRNLVLPTSQPIAPFFFFMTRSSFEWLSNEGLIAWVLYQSQVALNDHTIACLVLESTTGLKFEVKPGAKAAQSDIVAVGRELLFNIIRDTDTSWIERILSPDDELKLHTRTLKIPRRPGVTSAPRGTAAFSLLVRIRCWRASPYRTASDKRWIWRDLTVPPVHAMHLLVQEAFDGEVTYPCPSHAGRNVAFLLPIASFGGVERVAYNLAQQFARAGWQAHIFVIGQTNFEIPHEFRDSIASVNFIEHPAFSSWEPNSEYQGTALPPSRKSRGAVSRIVAALAWMDAVINCHSADFSPAAAELRHMGVVTAAHLHLLDISPHGRSVGHPIIALAYEHAYDLILCNSDNLRSWMHAAGIPQEKIVLVPNAPGHSIDLDTKKKILALRGKSVKAELNVMYLGRLDRQKGTDRLAELIEQTRASSMAVNWRVIGSTVTGDAPIPHVLQQLLEPPSFENVQLSSLFRWADVMVLLSDYEGVPLSVLEAQRLGVIVIATNVGALSEVISSGKNGFLVEPKTAVEQTISLLRFLIEVPTFRSAVAASAAEVMEWPEAAKELIQTIAEKTAARASVRLSAKVPSLLSAEVLEATLVDSEAGRNEIEQAAMPESR